MLEVQSSISEDGVLTAALVVATVDTWPMNDSRAIARSMGDVQTRLAVKQPQTGYTSSGSGVLSSINIENGKVTSLTREKSLTDGVWPKSGGPGIDQITLRNGQIVAINGLTS